MLLALLKPPAHTPHVLTYMQLPVFSCGTRKYCQTHSPLVRASIHVSMLQSNFQCLSPCSVIQSNFQCFTLNCNNSVLLHCLSSEPDNSHLKASHPTPHTTYVNRAQQFSKTGSRISKAQCIFAMLESFDPLSLSLSLSQPLLRSLYACPSLSPLSLPPSQSVSLSPSPTLSLLLF